MPFVFVAIVVVVVVVASSVAAALLLHPKQRLRFRLRAAFCALVFVLLA